MSFRILSCRPEPDLTSAASEQLPGDLPIRQDRVDALRAQIEAGAYPVNPHAIANAIFQNLFGAEDTFVRDPYRCWLDDRLRRSECLAIRRCECNWRQDDSQPDSLAG